MTCFSYCSQIGYIELMTSRSRPNLCRKVTLQRFWLCIFEESILCSKRIDTRYPFCEISEVHAEWNLSS